jgi:hypothetical protein
MACERAHARSASTAAPLSQATHQPQQHAEISD